jgi:hypothetical protein
VIPAAAITDEDGVVKILQLCGDDDGNMGLYCTVCQQEVTGYPDQKADLTLGTWGCVDLAEVVELAESHMAEAHGEAS